MSLFNNLPGRKPAPAQTSDGQEMLRILNLPIVREFSEQEVVASSRELMLADAYEAGRRLLPKQAEAVQAFREHLGAFLPIGVGHGKTGISLMCADHGYRMGLKKILLLIPPSVLGQLRQNITTWRSWVPLNLPFHVLGGRSRRVRGQMARSGRPGCYIMPYSLLSQEDAPDVLAAIDPDLIISDEAHQLKNRRSGKTKRMLHFLGQREEQNRPVHMVAMSGTMTKKGIEDYHHLMLACLGTGAPVPIPQRLAQEWGAVINSKAIAEANTGPLRPLVRWALAVEPSLSQELRHNISGFRTAFRVRLSTAPGVVATSDTEIGVSLGIVNREARTPDPRLTELIDQVQKEYITPNGDEIDHAIHTFKWLYELSSGFYNELVWPEIETVMTRRKLEKKDAVKLLARSKDYHAAEQYYHKKMREFLEFPPPGLETPMPVAKAINRGEVKGEIAEAYFEMKDADFHGRLERDARTVRVCPFKIDAAVEWAKERGKGILWVFNIEMGRWMMEALTAAGLDALHCPAGANDEIREVGDPDLGGKGDRLVVASIKAHHVGKNLQAFEDQLFVQWPRDAEVCEQVLGRLHRTGQQADHLDAVTLRTVPFDHLVFGAALNDAIYIQQTLGSNQKMVIADHDPMPKIFSPEFLKAKGTSPKMLDKEQRDMMAATFGDSWEDRV